MRILLIKPRWFVDGDIYKYKHRVPPLNLGIIAALSDGHEVRIIDEDVERIEYSPDWDLVGITAATFTSKKAYNISERFKSLGVKTVLGGIHPSLMPEESLSHCDVVVVGEAEPVWQKLLHDLEKNNLQKIYNGGCLEDMNKVPFPRRDLFVGSRSYFTDVIQMTRGCSNSCYYCYLKSVPWGRYRKRPIEKVYEEMSQTEKRHLTIVDDNPFVDIPYTKRLFDRIAPLNRRWGIQAPTTIAEDDELLEKMARAGCYLVGIGFQSVSQNTLDAAAITQNKVRQYKEIVRKMHKYDIFVAGFFMFGFDTDDCTSFETTVDMIKEMEIDEPVLYLLTPYPGTRLFAEMDRQGRILNKDWSRYSWYNCNFLPKNMGPKEMKKRFHETIGDINSYYKRIAPKMFWKYRHWALKDFRLTMYLCRNYFNFADVSKLP